MLVLEDSTLIALGPNPQVARKWITQSDLRLSLYESLQSLESFAKEGARKALAEIEDELRTLPVSREPASMTKRANLRREILALTRSLEKTVLYRCSMAPERSDPSAAQAELHKPN